jgi:hypothetical protein
MTYKQNELDIITESEILVVTTASFQSYYIRHYMCICVFVYTAAREVAHHNTKRNLHNICKDNC